MSVRSVMAKRRRGLGIPEMPRLKDSFLNFRKGLDQLTPSWRADPGMLRNCQNYEISISDGYQDIVGYERFDGNLSPSAASYITLDVTISGSFSDGDTVVDATTGASAVIVTGGVVTSGTQDYLVMTKFNGTNYGAGNNLEVSASVEGVVDNIQAVDSGSTNKLHGQYKNLAADVYRADISAVPGAGSILGIWMLNDIKYAFRSNVGSTAVDLHKNSSSGWVQVALGYELTFSSGGTYEILEADTITGNTSTETAVITRVMLESGSWDAGTAAGRLIYASQSGAFQAETLDVGANANVATIAADGSAITLSIGGRFEFDNSNFGGEAGAERIYGVDGVNRGFEFDGTVFCPIDTGMVVDAPLHVREHKKHLFFSFDGSAQHSGIGTPYIWTPLFGAAELVTGSVINGFMIEPGREDTAALGIYNNGRISMLYGTSSADWLLVQYREEIGAAAYSIQQMSTTTFFGDRGISDMRTVQDYGNFQHATYSRTIQNLINLKKTLVSSSVIARDKNQYRVFFSDGSAIYVTMNREDQDGVLGMMPIVFLNPVTCSFSLPLLSGSEEMFFGSTDGFVYQMEKGTSFDGDNILAYITTHFDFQKAIKWLKGYHTATLEAKGTGYAEITFDYDLDYGDSLISQPDISTEVIDLSGATSWDGGESWDEGGFWDGLNLKPATMKIGGSGENVSFTIQKNSDYFEPLLLSGLWLNYTLRRRLKQ
jgi:hypothetical protein